ncbi:L,D-transpeptidase [Lutibacter citreus]|uniref:L,D-transpeptidase n=1 Tax=Lutibacter citreus TaxID=2138210 RepID=UPI001FEC2381|nr:L,D-transpeptidase [Lutibacter citreus]
MILTLKILFKNFGVIALLIGVCSLNKMNKSYDISIIKSNSDSLKTVLITKNIKVKNYFNFIDSIVNSHNKTANYKLTEHLLVRYNPWIIDSLVQTDYYKMKQKDSFTYNQKELIALKKGTKIRIPDSIATVNLLNKFAKTKIDINIPEFKLRIFEDTLCKYEFSVRVGRNEKKYLKMGDRITDLRTIRGKGKIVKHIRNPSYYNPTNGHKYYLTTRDDLKITKMPQIPYIETEINGIRNGQMIHPTTNPITLGKAYSNGCIGASEGNIWIIYYYAEIGTTVNIRYDLNCVNDKGENIKLKNIYNYKKN